MGKGGGHLECRRKKVSATNMRLMEGAGGREKGQGRQRIGRACFWPLLLCLCEVAKGKWNDNSADELLPA